MFLGSVVQGTTAEYYWVLVQYHEIGSTRYTAYITNLIIPYQDVQGMN